MEKSESIKELASALAKAQGKLKAAEMNATNPFLKNRYADLGAIIQAAKPVLAEFGLSVAQPISGVDGTISVTTILMHQSGEWMQDTISMSLGEERGKSSAQVAGSIITYLRRYSLSSILGMYADQDEDGNEAKPAPKAQPVKVEPPETIMTRTTPEPAQVNGGATKKVGPTEFWAAVRALKVPQDKASAIASQFGNADWPAALAELEATYRK